MPFDFPVKIRDREGLNEFGATIAFDARDDVFRSGFKIGPLQC